ncbi:molybdopterin-dependent oxidoreductase [Roseomonas sp. OT10]|uniref:molybdopterin-dependent oxidoreductase n=1 Tax=Roseomonas cutis TaxID=2897332 RepID=UPI001E550A1A|nr:molybdopterin-dependent oxidoreductase [Roseomonas sp. OT10]UFN50111.1 molybdopterin-dependent oxidoreductase [Roseomonas sp. OT10]
MPGPVPAPHPTPARRPAGVAGVAPPASRRSVLLGLLAALPAARRAAAAPQEALPEPGGRVLLSLMGNIAVTNRNGRADFDRDMLRALGQRQLSTPTAWTDGIKQFEGVLARAVLERVGAQGGVVRARAVNDYMIDIPRQDFERYDVLLAYRMDGRDLTTRDKGPLWIVYPRSEHPELDDAQYNSRWVWQLRSLEVR